MATADVLDVQETQYVGDTLPLKKLNNIKKNASMRGKLCKLTTTHVRNLLDVNLNNGICDYTGTVFSSIPNHENYPSIDRIDPSIGYVPGNVIICTRRANNLKEQFYENPESHNAVYTNEDMLLISMIGNVLSTSIVSIAKKYLLKSDSVLPKLSLNFMIEIYEKLNTKSSTINDKTDKMQLMKTPAKYTISTIPLHKLRTVQESKAVAELSDLDVAKYMVEFSSKYDNVVLSFAEFQRKLRSKVCQFSSTNIEKCVLMVIDTSKPINYHNVFAIDAKYENVLKAVLDSGLGFKQFSATMSQMCTDLIIEK